MADSPQQPDENQVLDEVTGEPRDRTEADDQEQMEKTLNEPEDVEEEDLINQDFEQIEAEPESEQSSEPVRRNPTRTRKPTLKGRRALSKENRQPTKSQEKLDFDLPEKIIAPGSNEGHRYAPLTHADLLTKFRNLEYAYGQLVQDAKRQQKELSNKLTAANLKHGKAAFKVKALDAENRALKKHIRENDSSSAPAVTPKISYKGHSKSRLQIMRGTQTRVRDWGYLDLPVDPDGNRVGEIIFSEDEAEELKVMKEKRSAATPSRSRKRKVQVDQTTHQDDDNLLQEEMLAEAELAVQKNCEEKVTVTASGKISVVEAESVPQPEKVVEIQASASNSQTAKRPAFFPKAVVVKADLDGAGNHSHTLNAPSAPLSASGAITEQQVVPNPPTAIIQQATTVQQPQQHLHQQNVVPATPLQVVSTGSTGSLGTTTIQIPASALQGHQQIVAVQPQNQGQLEQTEQHVVYLLNADSATAEFANTGPGEMIVKDVSGKTWTI